MPWRAAGPGSAPPGGSSRPPTGPAGLTPPPQQGRSRPGPLRGLGQASAAPQNYELSPPRNYELSPAQNYELSPENARAWRAGGQAAGAAPLSLYQDDTVVGAGGQLKVVLPNLYFG